MPRHRGFCQPMAGSPLPSNPESALTQDSGHYRQFLGSTSAIRKSAFLASISLLLVSKSDFLVADELASFSDDPAQLYVGSVDGARVFALNVLECPRCRSRMRILAAIEDPVVARKILDCLGLPSRAPPVAPARHNRQDELAQF